MSEATSPIRDRILDAAFTAFMQLGYAGASTSRIALMAHVSKRDLYTAFGSKQGMLAACVNGAASRMRRPLALPAPRNRADLKSALIEFGVEFLLELGRPEMLATYRLAILESGNAPGLALTFDRLGPAESAALAGFLAIASERKLLKGGEPGEMAEFFFAILLGNGLLIRMLMRAAGAPTEADARERAKMTVKRLFRLYGAAK